MGTGLTGVLLCAGITVALAVACILIGKGLSLVTDKCYLITNKIAHATSLPVLNRLVIDILLLLP